MNLQENYGRQVRLRKLDEVTERLLGGTPTSPSPGESWWLAYIDRHQERLEAVLVLAHRLASMPQPLQLSVPELAQRVAELEAVPDLTQQEFRSNDDALAACELALQDNPYDIQALLLRGTLLNHLGQHTEALQVLDTVIRLDPGLSRAFNNRGIALLALGRAAEALVSFDEALWLDPANGSGQGNRALALYALGRYSAALVALDIALAQGEPTAALLNNRAETLSALNRHDEAIQDCERASQLDPALPNPHSVRGLALYAQGCFLPAVECFARADQLAKKQEPFFLLLQAIALLASGARQEGLRLLASPRFASYVGHQLLVVRTYQYLHALSRAGQLLRLAELKPLLEAGVRFPEGWWLSFTPSLVQAAQCQHDDLTWLPALTEVLYGGRPLSDLEPWPVWQTLPASA